jgi:cell division protein ZipA
LYSVANAVEPGTFDLSDLETLQTPGLTFFMQLPVPGDALEALDEMILSARTVAATLGGDVKDDSMSALTGQTVEHMKQRIADFARKQLTNANNN